MPAEDVRLQALRAAIARDPSPVRPLRPARRLGVALTLIAVGALGVLWRTVGPRADYEALGGLWVWIPSAVELLAAAGLLGLAVAETIPARRPSLAAVVAAACGAGALQLAISWATFARSPVAVAPGQEARLGLVCFSLELALALPVALAALAVVSRGLVGGPGRVAVAGGLGAGLAGDALWRLHCPYSDLSHVLTAHAGAVVALAVLALAAAVLWDRLRLTAWRRAVPR